MSQFERLAGHKKKFNIEFNIELTVSFSGLTQKRASYIGQKQSI